VITDIPQGADARREEFFGRSRRCTACSEEEAVQLANDTPYGLGSYVMTTDAEQGQRVADQLDAGMVYINAVGGEGAELPFGGVKRSASARAGQVRRRRVRQQEADPRRRVTGG